MDAPPSEKRQPQQAVAPAFRAVLEVVHRAHSFREDRLKHKPREHKTTQNETPTQTLHCRPIEKGFIRQLIESGRYNNASEVIHAALRESIAYLSASGESIAYLSASGALRTCPDMDIEH